MINLRIESEKDSWLYARNALDELPWLRGDTKKAMESGDSKTAKKLLETIIDYTTEITKNNNYLVTNRTKRKLIMRLSSISHYVETGKPYTK